MTTIQIHSLENFNAESKNRFLVVFDNLSQLQELESSSPLVKLFDFTSEGDFDNFKTLASKTKQSNETVSNFESYFSCTKDKTLTKFTVLVLPSSFSRHNTPSRSHALTNAIKANKGTDDVVIVLNPSVDSNIIAQVCAVGRQFPKYNGKSSESTSQNVNIVVNFNHTESSTKTIEIVTAYVENIRLAQELVDTPTNILHANAYVARCESIAATLGCKIHVIKGHELEERGFGGIWGVGKASDNLPALVVLSKYPENVEDDTTTPSVCLVGKGIVYDTGGLSLKSPGPNMVGMKTDMGGSASVLGAFVALTTTETLKRPVHALLCIAENSVGPLSTRPDDIHTLLSGKTVEINNTDAEGRLVLSDGCYYASKFLNPLAIIDIATLTGAQLIATGKNHAAIYCNDDELEELAVETGKLTGDLTFPIPYCPEFYKPEFRSVVADMKNSVADRGNAQSSCAGQFIGNHIEEYLQKGGKWLHIDMAGPAVAAERATGFGVALLSEITRRLNQI